MEVRKESGLSFLLFFFLYSVVSYSQLADFTLQVTKTDETCSGNGSLTFSVSNTTPDATIVYSVYLLPDTTNPVATQNANVLNGLVGGTYNIVATQTLGNTSNSQQANVVINSTIVPLTYTLTGTTGVCENGSITANILTGSAVSFEIFSGPVTMPLQSGNVFSGLPPGIYQVRVFDSCGEGIVQTLTLAGSAPGLSIGAVTYPNAMLPTCESISIRHAIVAPAGLSIAYPLQIEITIFPPNGDPSVVLTQTIVLGGNANIFGFDIPFFAGQLYSYNLKIVDACGNEYVRNGNNINRNLAVTLTTPQVGCGKALSVVPGNYVAPYFISFVSAPAGFVPGLYNATHPGPFTQGAQYYNPGVPIPEGLYIVQITDACGRTAQSQIQFVNNTTISPLIVETKKGCGPNEGSVRIGSSNGGLESVVITSAPSEYVPSLPHDVSFNITALNVFFMNSLPSGTYIFHTVDLCSNVSDATVTISGSESFSTAVEVFQNCASFDLALQHSSNVSAQNELFWLQELNTTTGEWGHPATGFSNNLNPSIFNSVVIYNNTTNVSLAFSGTFRILKSYEIYGNGVSVPVVCVEEIYQFEFDGLPKIEAVYSFSCSEDSSDVIVVATGAPPLIYRITQKNNLPFDGADQSSNLFSGLEPAIYNFQVEDACGNILNRIYDVTDPLVLAIAPQNLCNEQEGSLTLPSLPFLQFAWWKGSDTSTILSTTNSLAFSPFNAVTDAGLYHVSVVYPNANSCIDLVLDFEVSTNLSNPNAGIGSSASYCGNGQGVVNLFSLLTGDFDDFGEWSELTSSGALAGNIWDPATVLPGIYQFKYRVNGLCDSFDESTVTITVFSVPETPLAFLEQIPCENHPLQLLSTTIPNVTYEWSGPNGFNSNEQNPTLSNVSSETNGIYIVRVVSGSCASGTSSVEVLVVPSPEFSLEGSCDENAYILTVVPTNNSFDPLTANYAWTGPENFSSSINPIQITGLPSGLYSVTVTADNGCPASSSIQVERTLCNVPKGVSPDDDGNNDTFNLAGFDVKNLKIFNRYGMVVFEQENYIDQWRGQDFKGRELPSSTYYYLLVSESGETKSGWVYLQRKG
jgi:gliding motility-associated-like protein